jgi:hypothetical protein
MVIIMKSGLAALCAAGIAVAALSAAPAGAQTTNRLTACNAEWKAMKANGTAGDKKYTDFRKECLARLASPEAAPAPEAPAHGETTTAPAPTPPAAQPPAARPPRTATPTAPGAPTAPAAPGEAVFPSAVAPKYASESAGRARMHTCLDQWHANKATNANAGLPWTQKGGGYYSECNKRLKG